jgi:hypothetical protein
MILAHLLPDHFCVIHLILLLDYFFDRYFQLVFHLFQLLRLVLLRFLLLVLELLDMVL